MGLREMETNAGRAGPIRDLGLMAINPATKYLNLRTTVFTAAVVFMCRHFGQARVAGV